MRYFVPFAVFVLIAAGISYFTLDNNTKTQTPTPITVITPTPQPNVVQKTEVHSPDGTVKVILTSQKQDNETTTYTVMAAKITGENQKYIFNKTGDKETSIVLSQNAWSPDNKYLFVLEKKRDVITALVFKASGDVFANNDAYLDVAPLFMTKNKTLEIANITGWASESLLYVQTKTESLTKGPTFWFDIDSKNFLQLAG